MSELILIVNLGAERVAFPASAVEGVVEIEALTKVPRAARHVAGLAALRSRVLTVIDCLASLDAGRTAETDAREAVVVVLDGHPYALLVGGVEDVREADGEILPLQGKLRAGWSRVGLGMVQSGEELLLLVDVAVLIAGPSAQAA
jgi:purine-binding chemotaxis protein CheW